MISVENLSVHFGGVVALDALTFASGDDVVGLIGPNGAGKTTLINAISGFVNVASGSVSMGERVVTTMAPFRRARWGIARSFQKVQTVGELTVEEHLATVLDGQSLSRRDRRAAIDRALEYIGIQDARHVLGAELNPRLRRLTEIARCLTGSPRLVLLDEPGGGLAAGEMQDMHRIIRGINAEFDAQVLLVDHDMDLIRDVCRSAVVLDFGRLIAAGPTLDVLRDPAVRTAYLGR